jgi:hypothetical protein
MQIDKSDEQLPNAFAPICETFEPDSNVTIERDSHLEKQYLESSLTDEGMEIDASETQFKNAFSSIEDSLQPDSNATVERDLQPAKH